MAIPSASQIDSRLDCQVPQCKFFPSWLFFLQLPLLLSQSDSSPKEPAHVLSPQDTLQSFTTLAALPGTSVSTVFLADPSPVYPSKLWEASRTSPPLIASLSSKVSQKALLLLALLL